MANAGDVTVEIRARSEQFDRSIDRAREKTNQFDRAANKTSRDTMGRFRKAASSTSASTDKFRGSLDRAANTASLIDGPLGGIASRLTALKNISTAGAAGFLALAGGLTAVAAGLNAAINEAEKMETSFLRTEAIVKATGSSAGLTAGQIRELSREIALATLASTEGVEQAAQKLLTFRSVQGDVFTDALELSQDLAAVGFGSVQSAATQLGKALEDPEQGLSALRRVGVSFSAVQKQQIKDFVEVGRTADAQRLILSALQQQVGGAGRAEAGGLAGAYDTLGQRVDEFLENIGNSGPIQAMTGFVNGLANAVAGLNDVLFETEEERLTGLIARRQELQQIVQSDLPEFFKAPEREELARVTEQIQQIQNARVEQLKAESAALSAAEASHEQAAADRERAQQIEAVTTAQEAALSAAGALTQRRTDAIDSLISEVSVLQDLNAQLMATDMTASQLAQTREVLTTVTQLGLDLESQEARAIANLIQQRNTLTDSIERQAQAREDFQATQLSVQQEIDALNLQIETFGMAGTAAEQYRLKQELLNDATAAFGQVSEEQRAQIDALVESYGRSSEELQRLQDQQQRTEESQRRATQALEQFQNQAARGLTDVITGASSAEDAFKSLALSISEAILQAQILAAIQAVTGGGPGAGGGGALGGILASVLHSGGQQSGVRREVPVNAMISAPRFHNGLRADEFPAILQKGEEVIPKDEVGRRDRGDFTQVFNITTPNADSFRASRRQIARAERRRQTLR